MKRLGLALLVASCYMLSACSDRHQDINHQASFNPFRPGGDVVINQDKGKK